LSLVLLGVVFAQDANVDYFKEGQKRFGEQDFAGALEQFRKADGLVPDDPTINSWIAATLNAMGRYAEAKQRLEAAFEVLEDLARQSVPAGQAPPAIAVGFYSLMSEIQVNLRDFEGAVRTIESYAIPQDPSDGAGESKRAFEEVKNGVYRRLVSAGMSCLDADELDCARNAFLQADRLDPAPPSVLEAVARDALGKAARAPGSTDEEKTLKAELYEAAIEASRLWVAQAGPDSIVAQRVLGKALLGARTQQGYEEARDILTVMLEGHADAAQSEGSIQLDLAAAYTGLQDWDRAVAAASTAIEANPDDPLGEGYCRRSYAQYRLGNCEEAVADGQRCKNSDGTPRSLRHVDTCNERLALQARVAADREASLKRECEYLQQTVKWAIESGDISLGDLLKVIRDFEAGKEKCAPHLGASVRADSAAALCVAGVEPAGSPLNLSARSREELEQLRAQIEDFSRLCKSALDAAQIERVNGGLVKVGQALSMYR
jgi:tetratricopeptide (TPR) repeat protein